MKEQYVSVCPKCGSIDIEADMSQPANVATGLFNNLKKCNNCGNTGMFPESLKSQVPARVKEPDQVGKRELVSMDYGKGWKLIIGIAIISVLLPALYFLFSK